MEIHDLKAVLQILELQPHTPLLGLVFFCKLLWYLRGMKQSILLLIGILGFFALSAQETVLIYAINDPHGSIDNFPRLKKLIDNDRAQNSKVLRSKLMN